MRYSWIVGVVMAVAGVQVVAQTAPTTKAEPAAPSAAEVAAEKARLAEGGARVSPRQRAALAHAEAVADNQRDGDVFLNAYRRKPGVKALPSGVQYRVIKAHSGKSPTAASSVRVRYTGTLADGSGFDKVNDKAGTKLLLKGLVPGLQEALQRMSVGSTWEVVVPPALGYGNKGTQGVGPNAVLVYEVELLAVE